MPKRKAIALSAQANGAKESLTPWGSCLGIPSVKLQSTELQAMSKADLCKLLVKFNWIDGTWYSNSCCAGSIRSDSCVDCTTAQSQIRSAVFPSLWNADARMEDLSPRPSAITQVLRREIGARTIESFVDSEAAVDIVRYLELSPVAYVSFVDEGSQKSNVFTSCCQCHRPVVHAMIESTLPIGTTFLCSGCILSNKNKRRRLLTKSSGGQTSADSRAKITPLWNSPTLSRAKERFKNLQKQTRTDRKRNMRRMRKFVDALKAETQEFSVPASNSSETKHREDALNGVVTKLMTAMANNPEPDDDAIMAVLKNAIASNNGNNSYSREDAVEFAAGIRKEIENYAKLLLGKTSRVRFSPKVVQVAMTLWMRSPTAYEDLRQSGWIITIRISRGIASHMKYRGLPVLSLILMGSCVMYSPEIHQRNQLPK
jgi:hypothetical protein